MHYCHYITLAFNNKFKLNMSRAEKNTQAAIDWAKKKKEQMENAKRMREERKTQMNAGADLDMPPRKFKHNS